MCLDGSANVTSHCNGPPGAASPACGNQKCAGLDVLVELVDRSMLVDIKIFAIIVCVIVEVGFSASCSLLGLERCEMEQKVPTHGTKWLLSTIDLAWFTVITVKGPSTMLNMPGWGCHSAFTLQWPSWGCPARIQQSEMCWIGCVG